MAIRMFLVLQRRSSFDVQRLFTGGFPAEFARSDGHSSGSTCADQCLRLLIT
jgi:hypothetical protein